MVHYRLRANVLRGLPKGSLCEVASMKILRSYEFRCFAYLCLAVATVFQAAVLLARCSH